MTNCRLFVILFLSFLIFPLFAWASYDEWFENRSLRLDYIFSGDSVNQNISLEEMQSLPYWAGRRNYLDSLNLKGAGQIFVRDAQTHKLIYTTSFCSLFEEWQHTTEALNRTKAFENCFLVPYPKKPVYITLQLEDSWQSERSSRTVYVNPADMLIRRLDNNAVQPHRDILKNGSMEHCVDIAIVAEGYKQNQMDVFYNDVNKMCTQLFAHEPYTHMKNCFNIVAVASPSCEEGTSIPRQNIWKETALGSSFDTFYSDRYLTTLHVKKLYDILTGIPFDQIIVLVNTDKYGGGGIFNLYMLASTHNPYSLPVCVHEFGHSFAGLADEYDYGSSESEYYHKGVEPWEPNITTLTDFKSKWADMIEPDTPIPTPKSENKKIQYTKVGVFEGAGYMSKGVYRPAQECRMKVNNVPAFCPVCQRAIENVIRYYTE